jgi:uncharacterized surface protein with fasciclin (FAS1) repeats
MQQQVTDNTYLSRKDKKMKNVSVKLKIVFLIGAMAAILSAGSLKSAAAAEKMNIVETAVHAGQFKTLCAALKAAGLVETMEGKGPFTVFAPTDAAFAKLPKGVVANLLKPENKAKLVSILTYHVVAGKVMAAQAEHMKNGAKVKTLNGKEITIHNKHGVEINNAKVIKADIVCSNGVIHVINKVLLP